MTTPVAPPTTVDTTRPQATRLSPVRDTPAIRDVRDDERMRAGRNEVFYALPLVGFEYVGIPSFALRSGVLGITNQGSTFGLAYGGHVGFQAGIFRIGAMYQRTEMFQADNLNFNKLYLELGFGARRGWIGANFTVAGGWQFLQSQNIGLSSGGGGRLALGIDFYPSRWFSIGPEFAADGSGINVGGTTYGIWGVTAMLRLGLHI